MSLFGSVFVPVCILSPCPMILLHVYINTFLQHVESTLTCRENLNPIIYNLVHLHLTTHVTFTCSPVHSITLSPYPRLGDITGALPGFPQLLRGRRKQGWAVIATKPGKMLATFRFWVLAACVLGLWAASVPEAVDGDEEFEDLENLIRKLEVGDDDLGTRVKRGAGDKGVTWVYLTILFSQPNILRCN